MARSSWFIQVFGGPSPWGNFNPPSNRRMESTEHQPHSAAWGSFYCNLAEGAEGAGHSTFWWNMMEFGNWNQHGDQDSIPPLADLIWFDPLVFFFDISGVTTMSWTTRVFFHMDRPRGRKFSHGTDPQTLPQHATAKDCESQHRKNELNKNPTSSVIF